MILQPWMNPSNADLMMGLGIVQLIVFVVLIIVLGLVIETVFLKIALSIVDSKHTDFGDVFVTAIFCLLLGWIPIIGCLLCGAIIGSRHDTGFLVGIVVYILAILIGFVIVFLIAIAIVGAIYGVSVSIPFISSWF